MKQHFDHVAQKLFFTGASGTGKSTAAIGRLKSFRCNHRFIFDHDGEYGQRLNCLVSHSPAQIEACIKSGRAVVFDPVKLFPGRTREAFAWFCQLIWSKRSLPGGKLFFFDEPAIYLPSHPSKYESHPLRPILETGRRFRIDAMFCAQRPADVHNAVRQQATDIFCFRQGDPTSAKWIGQKGLNWGRVSTLPDGSFVHVSSKTGAIESGKIKLGA